MANLPHLLKCLALFILISGSLGHDMTYGQEGCAYEGEHKCMACYNLHCVDKPVGPTDPPTTAESLDDTVIINQETLHDGDMICDCKEGYKVEEEEDPKACLRVKDDGSLEPIAEDACSSAPGQATISTGIIFTSVGFFMIVQF